MSETIIKGKRLELLDIMKGVLIILVVLGHTNTFLTRWIYSFHMAAFFAISGFLWSDKYVENKESIFRFLKSRFIRIYIPFVAVNILFILLNNWFIDLNLYTTDAAFGELTSDWSVDQVGSYYGISKIITSCIESFFLISGSAPMVSTCWFLSTLLIISIGHLIIRLILKKTSSKVKNASLWILLILSLIVSYLVTLSIMSSFLGGLKRVFPAYFAFLAGCLYKEYREKINRIDKRILIAFKVLIVVGGIIMVIIDPRMVMISRGYIVNPFYFVVGFWHGIIIVLFVSELIKKTAVSGAVQYIGKKSLSIMLFHTLAFKPVNLLLIAIYGRDMVYLASRPVIYDLPQFWSLLYLVVGIGLPICVDFVIDKCKSKILIKNNN